MLTSDHSIVVYDNHRAFPDRLTRVTHRHYLAYAERMLAVYRAGTGQTRRQLHRAVNDILAGEPDCNRRRIASFCKLLDDASDFDSDERGQAAALRLKVFAMAAKYHPLVVEPTHVFERSELETKRLIAAELGRPWDEVETALYVDVIDRQPLKSFEGFESPAALLSRYNLAQLQACLYKSQRLSVNVSSDFATIVRYAKLSRLLVEAHRVSADNYRIDLSGPASVLHETRRYGVNFARFVAALVACRGWTMQASVPTPWGTTARLQVGSEDGYRSHHSVPPEFDSQLEESFAKDWGESREGWTLIRDAGILQSGQTTFVPDFLLRHSNGREVLLEIVGFWTPEYLEKKRRTLQLFRDRQILIAVPKKSLRPGASVPADVIVYKTALKAAAVLQLLEKIHPVV